jgi:hypothetical protein
VLVSSIDIDITIVTTFTNNSTSHCRMNESMEKDCIGAVRLYSDKKEKNSFDVPLSHDMPLCPVQDLHQARFRLVWLFYERVLFKRMAKSELYNKWFFLILIKGRFTYLVQKNKEENMIRIQANCEKIHIKRKLDKNVERHEYHKSNRNVEAITRSMYSIELTNHMYGGNNRGRMGWETKRFPSNLI